MQESEKFWLIPNYGGKSNLEDTRIIMPEIEELCDHIIDETMSNIFTEIIQINDQIFKINKIKVKNKKCDWKKEGF